MSQFTLYKNENKASKKAYPYFVNVQSDLLDSLNTRLVIPLANYDSLDHSNISHLCPLVEFSEGSFVLLTQQMTNVPASILKAPIISLERYRNEIIAAIDFLVTGI